MRFDLVDMRLMVRVAEASSLTGGAEASNISLPAASARVKNLEENIGAKLLHRTSQGVTLTPPGEAFVQHARAVLDQIEHLRSDLRQYTTGLKGQVRVFANTTSLGEYLPPVLGAYLRAHPDANIDLRERPSHDIIRAVADGQADIGIVAERVPTEALDTIAYRHDALVVVAPRGHELAAVGPIAFASTLGYEHVGLAESSALHVFLRQICDLLHQPLRLRIQVGNFETACRMIEAGVGIGVLPESASRRHAQSMAIDIVALTDPWAERKMQICVRSLDGLPMLARALVDLLIEDAARAEPGLHPEVHS